MNTIDYKNRLQSVINRVSHILIEYNREFELTQLNEFLSRNLSEQELLIIKGDILTLLSETLTVIQVKFVETEEPTTEEADMFRKYLIELKDYRQELNTPYSEIRKKVSTIIRTCRTSLNAELSNQSILFPNEYLDEILQRPEFKEDKSGDWAVSKINEGLSFLSEDVVIRIGACIDAINEVLNSKVEVISNTLPANVSNYKNEISTSDKIYGIGRHALPAVGLGGLTATIASTIINPFLAIGTGLVVGASFLYKGIVTSNLQQRRVEFKQKLAPKISLAINEMKNHVIEEFSAIEEQVNEYVNEISLVISQEMQDCMDAIKSCENDKKEFYRNQEIMNGHMTCLETYIKQVEVMMTNPFENK